jgi:hypothetical protein
VTGLIARVGGPFGGLLRAEVLLGLPPAILVTFGLSLRAMASPYFSDWRIDPAYAYLLNGLNILQSIPPAHTDHPGTTVQLLAALVIGIEWRIRHWFGSTLGLVESVLRDPESYLNHINLVLVMLLAFFIWLAAVLVHRITGSLIAALCVVALPLFSQTFVWSLIQVQPEPLLAGLAALATAMALPHTTSDRLLPLRAVLLGAILGAGIVTKLTFFPLWLLVLMLPGWRAPVIASASGGIWVVALTYPIWPVLGRTASWLEALLTHAGRYGSGGKGLPAHGQMVQTALVLLASEPMLAASFAFYGAAVVVGRSSGPPDEDKRGRIRLYSIGIAILLVQIAVAAKSPVLPGAALQTRYLLPLVGLTAVLLPLALVHLYRQRWIAISLAAAISLIFLDGAFQLARVVIWASGKSVTTMARVARIEAVARESGCGSVVFYGPSSLAFALSFGNEFAGRNYDSEIERIYPGLAGYDPFHKRLYNMSMAQSDATLAELPQLCLAGDFDISLAKAWDFYTNASPPAVLPLGYADGGFLYRLVAPHG